MKFSSLVKLLALCLGLAVLITFVPCVANADNTWDGGGGGSFIWSNNVNWGGDTAPGYGTLVFTGTTGTTNIMDANYSMNQINWNGTSAWTLNNSGGSVLSLFDNGGVQAKVENYSTGLVTINAPITFAATSGNGWGEINAVNGDITFGSGTLTVNGSQVGYIKMFGAGRTTTFNNTVSASGKAFYTTGASGGTVAIGGAFTSGDIFIMNGSTLNLNSGGSISTSQLRLGGDFGTTLTQNQALGATFALTNASGGQSFSSGINTVSGNTSNALLIDSQNTSGTNTISSTIALDSGLKIQQASGGNLSFTGGSFDIKAQTLTIQGSGNTTINEVLGSSLGAGGSLVKSGTGTLILQGTSNNYTGTTTSTLNANGTQIAGGTLGIYGDGSLGLAPSGAYNNIQFTASGTLQDTANNITLNANRNISIASGATATFDTLGNTMTVNGVINGSGAVTKVGSGTLTLSTATNTFSGGLTINSGTVAIDSNVRLGGTSGTAGAVTINGGTLQMNLGGTGQTNTHVITVGASGGTIKVTSSSATPTYILGNAGNLIGSGNLTISGNGTLVQAGGAGASVFVMGNANTGYSGNVTVTNGGVIEFASATGIPTTSTFTVNNLGMLSTAGVTIAQNVALNNGGTLAFQNNSNGVFSGTITLTGSTTARMQNWWSSTVNNGLISGKLTGTGSLTVNSGSGTGGVLTLTNATNDYAGTTTITSSTLQLGNGGATGALSAISAITDNGTLTINRNNPVTQGTDFSSAAITGSGAFIQLGSGTTTLNTANTFTGATTLTAGTLSVADTSYLGGASANNSIFFNGGTLQVTGTSMTSFGSHTVTYNASKTIGFDINNAANNFNAGSTAFTSTDTLLKTGAGTLTLGAASNTITTLQLNQGTLDIGSNNLAISNAGSTTINNATTNSVTINATGGGKIVLSQNNATDGPDIGAANGGTLTINANITGMSAFENWTGTANGTGVTVLTGQNDYTNDTLIHGGVLSVSNVGNSGSTTSNLGQGTTIHFGTGSTSTGTLLYTGTGETTNRVIDLQGTTAGGTIDASGSGLLKFTSNLTTTGAGAKTLTLQGSGSGEFAGNLINSSSATTITKNGAGTWTLSGSNTYTGQTTVSAGTLNYSGTNSSAGQINVGVAGGGNAVMNVLTGANINMGNNTHVFVGAGTSVSSGPGFVYQSGGTFQGGSQASGGAGYDKLYIGGAGQGSYGYYNMSGGSLNFTELDLAAGDSGYNGTGFGVMDMSGGTATIGQGSGNGWLIVNRGVGSGDIGILNLTGGTMTFTGPATQFQNNWGTNGTAVINVGNATLTAANADINLNQSNNSTNFGEINLLTGGTLQAHSIAPNANGTKLVNFNGGTLKASTATTTFITTNNTAVNVYGNGGTIDNNGVAITIPVALLSPTGSGVTATGATITAGSGYLGAPAVTFTGGGGTGAAGYVTVSGGVITGLVITNAGTGYTSAPTVVLTGGGSTSGAITLAAPVANTSGGLTFAGTGTTTLTGSNTYTGVTRINSGILNLGSAGALAGGGNITFGGGTMQYSAANSGQVDYSTNIVNSPGAIAIDTNSRNVTYASPLTSSNSGGLTKLGSGTLTLTASNAYAGTTTISAGTLQIGNGGTTGSLSTSSAITDNGTLAFNRSDTVTQGTDFSGSAINGTGALTQSGSGSLILTAANGYTGATTISSGTLQLGNGGTTGALSTSSAITDNGVLVFNRSNTVAQGTDFNSSAFGGTGSVIQSGSGNLTFSAANTFSGGLFINSGTVTISNNNQLGGAGGTAGAVTLNGGTLSTTTGITNSHAFTVGANGGTINIPTGGQYYFNATNTLLGSGTLTVTGSGTLAQGVGNLRVDHTNTYSGNMILQSGGNFEYGIAGAVGAGATFTVNDQGELIVQNGVTLPNAITVNGGTNSVLSFENGTTGIFSGPITLNADATIGLRDWYNYANVRSGTISGDISGAGGLTVNSGTGSGGVLTLTGTNSYTGTTTINSSMVQFAKEVSLYNNTPSSWTAANIIVGTGSTAAFNVGGTDEFTTSDVATLLTNIDGAVNNNGLQAGSKLAFDTTNAAGGTFTIPSAIADTTGTGGGAVGLTKLGANTLVLADTNTFSGATTISAGTLQFNEASSMSSSSAITVANGTTLSLNSDATNPTFTPGGNTVLSGGATFNVGNISSGTNQTITLAGTTQINAAGTLTVNGSNGYILSLPAVRVTGNGATNTFSPSIGSTLTIGTLSGQATYSFINFAGAGTTNVTGTISQLNASRSISLIFNQTGTVTISGSNDLRNNNNGSDGGGTPNGSNTFISVYSGTTNFNSNNAIYNSNSGNTFTINGGTIDNTSASAVTLAGGYSTYLYGNFAYGGTNSLTLNNNNVTLNLTPTITTAGTGILTLPGVVTGNYGLTVAGSGTLALTNSGNNFTGNLTINGGTVRQGGAAAGALGTGTITLGDGSTSASATLLGAGSGTITNTNPITIAGGGSGTYTIADTTGSDYNFSGAVALNNAATFKVTGAGQLQFTNSITGSSLITIDGGGTGTKFVKLSADNSSTFTGNVLIQNGNAQQSGLKLGASNALSNANTVTIDANSAIDLGGFNLSVAGLNDVVTGAGGSVVTGTGNITLGGSGNYSFSGVINNTGTKNLTKSGTGTQILAGSNTYTGSTLISSGTLQIGDGGTTGSISGTSGVTDNAALVYNRSDPLTVAYSIGGSGAVTQAGSGTLTFTGSNSYSGLTTIASGALQVGAGGTTGTLGSGNVVDNASLVFNRSDSVLVNNLISGSGSFTQAGVGVTTLGNSANTYGGATIITSGTLSVYTLANSGVASSIGSGSSVVVYGGGTLQYTGTTGTTNRQLTIGTGNATFDASGVGGITFSNAAGAAAFVGSGARTVTLTGAYVDIVNPNSFGPVLGDGPGGATSLVKSGVGTWVIPTANSYSGGTTLSGGILAVMDNGALGTGTVNFNGGAIASLGGAHTLTNAISTALAAGNVNGSQDLRFNGAISGGNGMVINNTGITTYGTANSYTGSTTVNAGATLRTEAAGALSSTSMIAVNSGTLIDAASNSIGTSTATAPGLTMGSTLTVDDSGGAVTDYIGALTLTANSTINLTNNGINSALNFLSLTTGGFTLTINNWQGTGGASGTGDQLFSTTSYSDAQLAQISFAGFGSGATQIGFGEIVPLSAVPEPGTIVGALLLAGFVGYRERRRVLGLWNGFSKGMKPQRI